MAPAPRPRALLALVLLVVVLAGAACQTLSLVESIESLLRQARELLEARRWDEALVKLQEVIRRDPKRWEAYLHAARAYIGKAAWTDALASGRQAVALAPDKTQALGVLGEALWGAALEAVRQGRFAEAASHLTEYVRLRPGDVQGWLALGRAQWQAGQRMDALAAFRRVLELAPGHEEALKVLGGGR